MAQSFVWGSAAREGFVDSVQRMRRRVTEHIRPEELDVQLKLGPGGLRDIEFTVQLLQLVHGQSDPEVRVRGTLTALRQLADGGYIGRVEAAEFAEEYRFLRLLEHRVQLRRLRGRISCRRPSPSCACSRGRAVSRRTPATSPSAGRG